MGRRYRRNDKVAVDESSPLFDEMDRQRTCLQKKRYGSEWQAKFAADEAGSISGVRLGWYRCPYCGEWHLTEIS